MDTTRFDGKIIALIGSRSFEDIFHEAARDLALRGAIVLTLHVFDREGLSEEDLEVLVKVNNRQMEMSDIVMVVTNGDRYIGESTQSEINYARSIDKQVELLYERPKS